MADGIERGDRVAIWAPNWPSGSWPPWARRRRGRAGPAQHPLQGDRGGVRPARVGGPAPLHRPGVPRHRLSGLLDEAVAAGRRGARPRAGGGAAPDADGDPRRRELPAGDRRRRLGAFLAGGRPVRGRRGRRADGVDHRRTTSPT